jgi:hypothetical protein
MEYRSLATVILFRLLLSAVITVARGSAGAEVNET